MSALDPLARGLAAQARTLTLPRARVLLAADRSGPFTAPAAASLTRPAHSIVLPGDTIVGGAHLRLRALIAKYAPVAAGHSWRARLVQGANSVTIGQNAIGASLQSALIDHAVVISSDRRWGYCYAVNALSQTTLAAGQAATTGAQVAAMATLNANQASTGIAFASYSAAPIVETVLIDFAQPVTLTVDLTAQNGDTVELLGLSIELVASDTSRAINHAAATATACWGDSLTQGAGATADASRPMDYPSQVRRLRAGRPVINRGLGGQTAQQIADRIVADPIHGRHWDAVVWMGINDAQAVGTAWWATLEAQLDRVLAHRAAGTGARTLFLNLYPRSDWPTGHAFNTAVAYVNAALATKLGAALVDVATPLLAGGSDGTPNSAYLVGGGDLVHLNNAGYGVVRDAIDAKMTASGWA